LDIDIPLWAYPIIIACCIILSCFFTLEETAYTCLNRFRFEVKAQNGSRSARLVLYLHKHFDSTLIAVLTLNNAVNIVSSTVATYLFVALLNPLDEWWSTLIGTICLTIVLYLLGETLPKQIGQKIPNKIASATIYVFAFFYFLLWPILMLCHLISIAFHKVFKTKSEPLITEEDFTDAIETNEDAGLLEENESGILVNSLDFMDTKVRDILTPKRKMQAINLKGKSLKEISEIVANSNYSRIPLYVDNPNKIVGVLLVKSFLINYLNNPATPLKESIEKPFIVSPNICLDDLADGFRERHTHIALVYRKEELIGMVTMEDVLEELVGPISEKALPKATLKVEKKND